MKFKINQTEFAKALLLVNKSLSQKTNLPILSNILFLVGNDKVEILSTNLESATKTQISCQVDEDGKTTVPGRILTEFISQLPEGEITVEKLGEEVAISTKNHGGRFATMPTEDFPAIPKIDKGLSFTVLAQDLSRSVSRVAFCAAADEGRPVLTGVLCELGKEELSMVATDGYRLSFQKISVAKGGGPQIKVLVPSRAISEVGKLISEIGEGEEEINVEIIVGEGLNQINFKIARQKGGANVEFTSRLIEGEFPAWQKIIPSTFSSSARVSREELIRLVRLASIFARDSGNIIRFNLLQEAGAKSSIMKVSANSSQIGSNEAECEIELTGRGGEIAFNFRYLLEMLASIEGDEINFEMIESLNPGKLTVPGDNDYFHIIMPVRLQS